MEDYYMCGRFLNYSEEDLAEMEAIIEEIDRKYGAGTIDTGEIFPTHTVPVIIQAGQEPAPIPMKWGFPRYNSKGVIINARSETAMEKNMFKKGFLEKPCIIPALGYFEWQAVPGQKQKKKYLLKWPEQQMLYLAGLSGSFRNNQGMLYEAFVILTRGAQTSIADIHSRMPVIIKSHELQDWLADINFREMALLREGPELVAALQ
jgi:putative SOS response-associated peptidase YedK